MIARPLWTAVLAVAALGGAARAEAPAPTPPAENGMAACAQMMQTHKTDLAALEAKTAAMNATQGSEKIDAIAAVVNALVAEHRAMADACPMMGGGMEHAGPAHGSAHDGAPHDAPAAPTGGAMP